MDACIDLSARAAFSPCQRYRYSLWRELAMFGDGIILFIGLNPSTATAEVDDPTCRREQDFAKRWGYSRYAKANLFAYRATKPEDMKRVGDPVGADNDRWLLALARAASTVVAAWGVHGTHLDRSQRVETLLAEHGVELKCLGRNKDGTPVHPLYQPATRVLEDYPG